MGVMVVTSLSNFVTTRLIIDSAGADAFAVYALLTTIPALLPFADLGVGASVVNTIAGTRDVKRDVHIRMTLLSAFRMTLVAAGVVLLLSLALYLLGAWPVVLGGSAATAGLGVVALLCFTMFGVSVPLALGTRVLLGLSRNQLVIVLQGLQGPLVLIAVAAFLPVLKDHDGALALCWYVVAASVAVVGFVVAARRLGEPFLWAVRNILAWEQRGTRIMGTAWPLMIRTGILAAGLQTGRLLISHLGTNQQLAEYSLASLVYGSIGSVVSAAGLTLWPYYAKARSENAYVSPFAASFLFAGGSAALCVAVIVVSPWLFSILSGGAISVSLPTLLTLSFLTTVQAFLYPMTMFLMDKNGLRFQLAPAALMTLMALTLSALLIPSIGAAGPGISTAVSILLVQVTTSTVYIHWRQKRLGRSGP